MLFDTQPHQQDGDFYTRSFQTEAKEGNLILNMGPQHPSTHGVLRIIVELEGEYVRRAEPVLGYIHRMQEKMGEVKTWQQYLPNMGRVDYLHALAWNWGYVGAVERLIGLEVPERAEFIRVITCELNRINSHLLWWGAYLLDLGAFTPIMYAFADREEVMDMLQIVTGSRLTYCYYRIGGVSNDITPEFIDQLKRFCTHFKARLPLFRDLVTDNMILRYRTEGIGHMSLDVIQRYGATGPVIRGSGEPYDIRRVEPYSVYDRFDFDIPVFHEADAFARYMVRMHEMEQSVRIIEQALEQLPDGPVMNPKAPLQLASPPGEAYFAVESARGKVGVYVVSDGGPKPYRVKLRAPSFSNLHLFAEVSKGVLLSDAVSILGSLDLVIPEIDR
ncbi:NADH-quinone oxidoreductase subunit D [Desulfonatronum thiodismutans]|uniref:NADH-quinone oxidoreductase subunit D n=1 Tax=Desulfonatronum thiodismutans TaxID=159290 RepID=UPI0004ABE545